MSEQAEYYIDTQMNFADPETEHGYINDFEVDGIMTEKMEIGLGEFQYFRETPKSFELWDGYNMLPRRLKRWDKKRIRAVHYKNNEPGVWSVQ